MKKIMFSTEYGLQQGVIASTKTMTRRVDKKLNHPLVTDISEWGIDDKGKCYLTITYSTGLTEDVYPAYQIGEEVAVAQSYSSIEREIEKEGLPLNIKDKFRKHKGWTNKMFVKAEYMPHSIRITNIKVERLQDISDEDCLREGITEEDTPTDTGYSFFGTQGNWETPRAAFAVLIDKVSGKGTWERNPWVFAYTFRLVQ